MWSKKDLIIIRGSNYYPNDIEKIVAQHPDIRTGCVIAFSYRGLFPKNSHSNWSKK